MAGQRLAPLQSCVPDARSEDADGPELVHRMAKETEWARAGHDVPSRPANDQHALARVLCRVSKVLERTR